MKWKISTQFVIAIVVITLVITMINFFTFPYFLGTTFNIESKEESLIYPEKFTLAFSNNLLIEKGKAPVVTDTGLQALEKEGAWIQILDENGNEVYSWRKPPHAQMHYTPGDIAFFYKYSVKGYTSFISREEKNGWKLSYLIGFPDNRIARYPLYVNPGKISTFWPQGIFFVIGSTVAVVLLICYFFGRKLTSPIVKIIEGITILADGTYSVRYSPKGLYKDVYQSLNHLSATLLRLEMEREKTESMREEWITNLSHDLKTPLTSLKGYGELLAEPGYRLEVEERVKYASVIVEKSMYMEELLEDLKLTSQLKNNLLPLAKKEDNIVVLLREITIQLLNQPQFEEREVGFTVDKEFISMTFDAKLLRRAFMNLIYNALVHNPPETHITITVREDQTATIVVIEDDGNGIADEEIVKIFDRYYRGTSTGENHQGSGLGMAIAQQIINAHQGTINVVSRIGKGTTVTITFER